MPEKTGRTARHRSLVREIEKLRKNAGLPSHEAAAQVLGWKRLKYQRLVSTETMPTLGDVSQILGAFGDPDGRKNLAILELARHVNERGWWVAYDGIIDGSYAELEDEADRILSFQPQAIPGLLQEASYAREILGADGGTEVDRARRLQARMLRRAVLDREKPPELNVVLTEEVFDRMAGEVMQAQSRFLLAMAERPNISIRVIAKERGAYPHQGQGPVVIFEFDSPIDLNTGYVETLAGGYYVEESDKVKACTDAFHNAAAAALTREETRALIAAKLT